MRKTIIETATGLVENIIEIAADAVYDPGAGRELRDATDARIGGTWDGTKFLPPPEPPPAPPTSDETLADALDTAIDDPSRWAALAAHLRGK